jgi:membrane protein
MAPAQPGVKGLAVAFRDTYKRHAIQDIAASVTYWTILSIVPAALAVTAVLGWLEVIIGKQAADDVRTEIVEFVERTLGTAGGEISTTIIDILTGPSSGVAIVGFLLAVWSMSKGFASLFRGLARIHGNPDGRNNLVGRLLGLAFGVATVLVVLVLLLSLVAGPLLGFEELLPNDGGLVVSVWSVARWPILTVGIVAWIALLLSRGPGTGLPWKEALPGAALAAIGWALITIGFDIYLQLSSGANPLFRSLGSVIVALYWLYLVIIALLIGGALNAIRQGQTPTPAEAAQAAGAARGEGEGDPG